MRPEGDTKYCGVNKKCKHDERFSSTLLFSYLITQFIVGFLDLKQPGNKKCNYQVCVDAGVSGCSGQVLVLSVRDVLPGPVIAILLGQSEVDEEELVAVAADAHQEVVWFDVAVDEVLVVHVLDATDHLKTKRRLKG